MAQRVHSDITRTKIVQMETKKFQKGDVVFLKADYNQDNWPIAHIMEIVRIIKLRFGDAIGAEQRELV